MVRKALTIGMLMFSALAALASDINLIPEVHATLRTRFEWATSSNEMRFQVRNARVGLTGKVCPIVSYKAEVDFCDRGSIKFLDVWGRVDLGSHFKAQLGNMRIPFTIGSGVAPHQYLFANRPFVDKQVGSPRNVGLKLIYDAVSRPIVLEVGVFNTIANTKQTMWQKRMAGAAKLKYSVDRLTFTTGVESLVPDSVSTNNAAFGVTWRSDRWFAEAEYVYRHYTNDAARDAHVYNLMADYRLPLKSEHFNRLSFQARWDGMTDHCDATKFTDEGRMIVTDAACNRITVGTTLSYVYKKVNADIRLNYENYIFRRGVHDPTADKVVVELVVHF